MKKLLLTALLLLVAIPTTAQRQFTLEKTLDAIPEDSTGVHVAATCGNWPAGVEGELEVSLIYPGGGTWATRLKVQQPCLSAMRAALSWPQGVEQLFGTMRPAAVRIRLTTTKRVLSRVSIATDTLKPAEYGNVRYSQ